MRNICARGRRCAIARVGAFVRLALHARALALHDMGQLVRQQLIAIFASRRELAAAEMHIVADGEGFGAERGCSLLGFATGSDPNVREVRAQARLHAGANVLGQRRTAA